jgi:hypothetical protein
MKSRNNNYNNYSNLLKAIKNIKIDDSIRPKVYNFNLSSFKIVNGKIKIKK